MLAGLLVCAPAAPAEEQRNMRLVGMDDLQARSAYQPVVHHQGARWIGRASCRERVFITV